MCSHEYLKISTTRNNAVFLSNHTFIGVVRHVHFGPCVRQSDGGKIRAVTMWSFHGFGEKVSSQRYSRVKYVFSLQTTDVMWKWLICDLAESPLCIRQCLFDELRFVPLVSFGGTLGSLWPPLGAPGSHWPSLGVLWLEALRCPLDFIEQMISNVSNSFKI